MELEDLLQAQLAAAADADLLRTPKTYEGGATVLGNATGSWVSFASNDYLGLTEDPTLREAIARGAESHAGAGASRVVTGTSPVHVAAEVSLAQLVRLPTARIFSSAYAANLGVLGSLFGPEDLVLSDALNHASLIDGSRLGRARVHIYRHGDLEHLRGLLRDHRGAARVAAIVTETAFSMDGDIADLAALHGIAREHQAALVVDEAHALGVIGPEGRGVCAQAGVRPDVLIGGLGKAFGLAGGFVAGSAALGRAIDNFARTFVFSTAILPAIAHAVPVATQLLLAADPARARLAAHATRIREAAGRWGLGRAPSVIVPVVLGGSARALEVAEALRARGLLVPAMRPPTVPAGTARLRITPTALHTGSQIDALSSALVEVLGSPRHRDDRDERDHA